MNRYDRIATATAGTHLDVIRRVDSNDPFLEELAIGDILDDERTATLLAKALRGNTNLRRVMFRQYGYDMDHFHTVLSALSDTNVSKISVGPQSQILQYEGSYAMAVGTQLISLHSLTKLDLNACHIGPSGAIVLSALLADNDTLKELHLPENEIGDEGAVAVAHMLKNKNRALKEIVLDNNGIMAHGQLALRNAIFDDSSFEELARSNHVLQSYFYNPRSVFGKPVMNDILLSHAANLRSKSAKAAVTKKLKRMLYKKYRVNLNFECFLRMDAVFMPLVLGWMAQKCDIQMMYEFKPILLNLLEGREC
eukprot:CAMPEP_0172555454 /NCGR_PEP_ID=MMETSP1067-20121228/58424_1 /TAXON_ID=265564 ORGANISM="Thalassiosira punctigera, Strain Tpunct2005C2" /NCGR_SAMPLE_ID=MMETSP1067 /ASSEMBLY_ACC=CAM_ASM_000444 /LENGTH=308 /DNA_ID=CAMNT_0013343977 /DNA_START=39 /DNA_END=965 /DNA_ORIENTATION=+